MRIAFLVPLLFLTLAACVSVEREPPRTATVIAPAPAPTTTYVTPAPPPPTSTTIVRSP